MRLDREKHAELLAKLETVGDARRIKVWHNAQEVDYHDYVATLQLRDDSVPELVAIALDWAYREEWPEDESDISIWAPIHAWRALGQLGTPQATEPLLDVLDRLHEREDEWGPYEFGLVVAMIGAQAWPPVRDRIIANKMKSVYSAMALVEIAQKLFKTAISERTAIVDTLGQALSKYKTNDPLLNGSLVSALVEIDQERRYSVLMERAFADDHVDEQFVGAWGDIRKEMGIEGLGIASDERRDHWWHCGGFSTPLPHVTTPKVDTTSTKSRHRVNPSVKRKQRKRRRKRRR